jgi:hypothetical protein
MRHFFKEYNPVFAKALGLLPISSFHFTPKLLINTPTVEINIKCGPPYKLKNYSNSA